jgi:hypothetical protein
VRRKTVRQEKHLKRLALGVFLGDVTLGLKNWKSIIEDIKLFNKFQSNKSYLYI